MQPNATVYSGTKGDKSLTTNPTNSTVVTSERARPVPLVTMELLTIPILLLVLFMNWVVKHTSNGTRTFFDPSIYPWTSELTANWRQIRAELDTVAIDLDAIPNYQDISAELRDLTNDDKWKTFVLSMLGK